MRVIVVTACMLALVLTSIFTGCQSVATTSAKLRNQEGNYDLAIELANQAIEQNPNDAEAYFQLGVSYSHLDSVDKAYNCFMKSIELEPTKESFANDNIQHNYAKHYNLGQKAYNKEDFASAASEFELATKADPRQSVGFYNLGISYHRLAEADSTYYDKAIKALDTALEKSTPDEKHYIDALKATGKVFADVGRVEEAVSRFNRLVEEDPTNYGIMESLGYERMEALDWKGAAIFFDLAARARDKIGAADFNLFYNLGAVNYNMRKDDPEAVERAIEYYRRALDLKANEPTTVLNIAIAYMSLKDWPQTIAWGEQYVSIDPEDERGWQILARAYGETGDQEKARQCSTRYEEIMKMKGKAQ